MNALLAQSPSLKGTCTPTMVARSTRASKLAREARLAITWGAPPLTEAHYVFMSAANLARVATAVEAQLTHQFRQPIVLTLDDGFVSLIITIITNPEALMSARGPQPLSVLNATLYANSVRDQASALSAEDRFRYYYRNGPNQTRQSMRVERPHDATNNAGTRGPTRLEIGAGKLLQTQYAEIRANAAATERRIWGRMCTQ